MSLRVKQRYALGDEEVTWKVGVEIDMFLLFNFLSYSWARNRIESLSITYFHSSIYAVTRELVNKKEHNRCLINLAAGLSA
jgi:hypothetical protein